MNDFLSGSNFALHSDLIFCENYYDHNNKKITVKILDEFELDSGNIVFCKTDYITVLFDVLKDEEDISNIKLITHQSDYDINERLFNLKPKCISKWYAQNVNYVHDDLIPIPIGLGDDYFSYYSLTSSHFNNTKKTTPKKKLLYINHRNSTYPQSRTWIYDYFKTNDWCTVDQPNLSLDQYKNQLDNHEFILCPRGNGIDTHRLWESLYHGIIPIVENHIHYSCLKDLPVLIVESFKEIDKNFLLQKKEEILKKTFIMDKLKISWWINFIRENNLAL